MRSLLSQVHAHYIRFIATAVAIILHKTNSILRLLATIFNSDTMDKLATDYSNWYNLGIIGSLLNFEGMISSNKVYLHVMSQETLDDLMITKLKHQNLGDKDIETYVHTRLLLMGGIDHSSVRLTHLSKGESKLLIPIITHEL